MKHTLSFVVVLFFYFSATTSLQAQNTFPTPTGNVGIGVSPASYPLHVVTSGGVPAFFKANTATNCSIQFANANNQMNIGFGSAIPHASIWSTSATFFIATEVAPHIFITG